MNSVNKSLNALTLVIFPLALVVALTPIITFWFPDQFEFFSNELVEKHGGVARLVFWQKLVGFFVTAVPMLLLLSALWTLRQLILNLKAGGWFDELSESLCRRFGKLLLWYVVAEIIHRTLLVLVLTITNEPGDRYLQISFSSNHLAAIIPALLAMVFAHAVSLGRAQRDELQQIV